MIRLFKEEFSALGQFLKRNGNETIILVSAILFITLDRYHPIGSTWFSTFFYFGFLPLLVIIIFLRKNPLDFGLRWGNPRVWWFLVVLFCVVAAIILLASSASTTLQSYYQNKGFNFITYFLTSCFSLGASEFMYRGYLLFGLKEKFQEGSILLQMVPFVLLHFGKPELETVSTIITGILFGYVCYRGKSFWPAFIIHLFINIFFVSYINFRYPITG
jgi:membrane protease YdiL (CAAX protease family)